MHRLVLACILFLGLLTQPGFADPWFTGPILALSAKNMQRAHLGAILATGTAVSNAIYNSQWRYTPQAQFTSTQITPEIAYGLTDRLDLQFNTLYQINNSDAISYEHIGDTALLFGFQAFTQQNSRPDLRITLQEVIPTGRFNQLTPSQNGAQATGMGSYQTSLGLNFQYLTQLNEKHYLNTYLNIAYTYTGLVKLKGVSSYGGTSHTHGHINPGDAFSLDLAAEFTLTQQWVAVMEANYIYQQASKFKGILGERGLFDPVSVSNLRSQIGQHRPSRLFPTKNNIGKRDIGSGTLDQISFAPALEYNFSENYGVISGVWFTVTGKNTPEFAMPIIQFMGIW